jgi:hypothetical protein
MWYVYCAEFWRGEGEAGQDYGLDVAGDEIVVDLVAKLALHLVDLA